jgi:hypothetical protein
MNRSTDPGNVAPVESPRGNRFNRLHPQRHHDGLVERAADEPLHGPGQRGACRISPVASREAAVLSEHDNSRNITGVISPCTNRLSILSPIKPLTRLIGLTQYLFSGT